MPTKLPQLGIFNQHQSKGNNDNSNGHLMRHLYGANAIMLLSGEVEKVL